MDDRIRRGCRASGRAGSATIRRLTPVAEAGALALALLLTACAPAEQAPSVSYSIPEQPEMATGYDEKPGWATSESAVAAAHPLAADAGFQILEAGGSAADAAVAVQMVLTLVEPQSSGIGGGAFLLHWDGREITGFNGREKAPAAAGEDHFLDADGEPLPFRDAVRSGLSVGVPGTVAMLEAVHERHGRLAWSELFTPAITLAEEGFAVSPRLHTLLDADESLRRDPLARALYYDDDGDAHPVGHRLTNPALARVLRRVAAEGSEAFYEGPVAEDIVDRVRGHPERPGNMSLEDLAAYPEQDFQRDAICSAWRVYELCGFPPPASGHLAIGQILGILEHLDAPDDAVVDGAPSAEWLHYYVEASKLAFADRNRYVADAEFVDPPGGSWQSLLDPDYLAERAALVGPTSMDRAEPGDPTEGADSLGSQALQPDSGTSHVSIVDREGNAISMTTTIESGFGSRIMSDGGTGLSGGFHLNNELTDFSLAPRDDEGRPIANRVEPGKRPRSSMSPTLAFRTGPASTSDGGAQRSREFVASVGSPGGTTIIHYTAKALLGMLAWDLDAQRAIDLPNFANYNGPTVLESGRFPPETLSALRQRGHEVRESSLTSGIQAIQRTPEGYFGGADPRREGVVTGR